MMLRLDHVNLRTAELERATRFYVDVLGLRVGPRPAFSFGGAWLYCGDVPIVHLVEVAETPSPAGALRLEHFALRATGLVELLDRLKARGIAPRFGFVRDFGICQVNVFDPDGNHLHIDFDLAEASAAGIG